VVAASDKEDHRHADTFGWYRSGQDYVPSGGTGYCRQGARTEEVHTAIGIHREHADVSDWPGSVLGGALPSSRIIEARS
jgi:hypothetical protein